MNWFISEWIFRTCPSEWIVRPRKWRLSVKKVCKMCMHILLAYTLIKCMYITVEKKDIVVSGRITKRSVVKCFVCSKEYTSKHLRRHLKCHDIPREEMEYEISKLYGKKAQRTLSQCPTCNKFVSNSVQIMPRLDFISLTCYKLYLFCRWRTSGCILRQCTNQQKPKWHKR